MAGLLPAPVVIALLRLRRRHELTDADHDALFDQFGTTVPSRAVVIAQRECLGTGYRLDSRELDNAFDACLIEMLREHHRRRAAPTLPSLLA